MKISELIVRLQGMQQQLPVDEIAVELPEGDVYLVDSVKYNSMTGFAHVYFELPEED